MEARENGIPLPGKIRPQGAGTGVRRRHLRRPWTALRRLGRHRARRRAQDRRHLPRRRREPLRQRRRLLRRRLGEHPRRGAPGTARPRHRLHQAVAATRRRAERRGGLAPSPPRRRGRLAASPAHGLHRHPAAARLRRDDAGRAGALDAGWPRSRGQGPLHRRIELLRLAAHEVARRRGPPGARAPRGAPGVLLAGRPRLRMGADATRLRPGRGGDRLEPARVGAPDR